jgi:hypothetical protein
MGDEHCFQVAKASRGELTSLLRTTLLLTNSAKESDITLNGSERDRWRLWIDMEFRRRIALAIYVRFCFPLFKLPRENEKLIS